jgi:aspartyl-tRNA(Asn)/glutamyl-tRNA(Gln) amidotransferase subunit B
VKKKGLGQVSDEEPIKVAIEKVIKENPDQVTLYLGGKETVAKWFFGQVMRGMGGKSNPSVVQKVLDEKLEDLKRK